MNKRKIQTKRKAKTGFRTYFAKTATKGGKKTQRAATATADDIEGDIPQVGIGRALSVILVLHLVAIAAIYMGTKWRSGDDGNSAVAAYDESQDASSNGNGNTGKLNVSTPSSYTETQQQQQQQQARNSNTAQGNDAPVSDRPQIQVAQRQPRVITPRINPNTTTQPALASLPEPQIRGSLKKYKIVSGDTGYGIARKHGVKLAKIQSVNKGVNMSKIKPGQVINIPSK